MNALASMPRRSLRWPDALLAILAAVAVNLALALLLLMLNRADAAAPPKAEEPRLTILTEDTVRTAASKDPEAGGPAAPQEPVTIDLDAPPVPTVTPPTELTPVELDVQFDMPELAAISVTVAAAPIKVAAPRPVTAGEVKQMMQDLGLPQRTRPPASTTASGATGPGKGEGTLSAEGVDKPPRAIRKPQPTYPSFARRAGLEGNVTVKLLIDTTGHVAEVQIVTVDGHESFRQAVLDVVRTWRFEPASHRGRVVPVWGVAKVTFALEK